jgi:hypothetical protein
MDGRSTAAAKGHGGMTRHAAEPYDDMEGGLMLPAAEAFAVNQLVTAACHWRINPCSRTAARLIESVDKLKALRTHEWTTL